MAEHDNHDKHDGDDDAPLTRLEKARYQLVSMALSWSSMTMQELATNHHSCLVHEVEAAIDSAAVQLVRELQAHRDKIREN